MALDSRASVEMEKTCDGTYSFAIATTALGYNTCEDGTNVFCVPASATYTKSNLDVFTLVVFNSEKWGFLIRIRAFWFCLMYKIYV